MIETSVKFIRLVTGEDIISEMTYIETEKDSQYVLSNPMKVLYIPSGKGNMLSITLSQWVYWRICEEQEFTLKDKDVLLVNDCSSSMEEYYWSTIEHLESYKETVISKESEQSNEVEEVEEDTITSIIEMLKDTKRILH
jgi:hypothetical protein